ncbi:MAG: glycosyltransferase [Oscillospiraceae bacterium]|nr:glycosyltransferase [Oscillospiraceae bacterium]
MKKLLYLTEVNFGENLNGISYKIFKQIKIFENNEFEVITANNFFKSEFWRKILSFIPSLDFRHDYKVIENIEGIDYIYIRYYLTNLHLLKFLKKVKKNNPNVKIFIEIPTFPYDNEIPFYNHRLLEDKLTRGKLVDYVDRIVTFSNDNNIFGIDTICISNGVDTSKINLGNVENRISTTINIIAVAQICFWHGYDRIIKGLKLYYDNGGTEDIHIHIVGDGVDKVISNYKNMVNKYNLESKITFYGRLYGEKLDEVYNICSLGFDSLGRHRSKVSYNSSLKGKEYMAKGLPSISGVKTELDSMNEYKYYLRIPADDTPVDFNSVTEFYHKIYDNGRSVSEIAFEIRKYCETFFEFSKSFDPVIEEYKNL